MDVGVVIFILGFLMIVASIYVYSSKDQSAYQDVLETMKHQSARIGTLENTASGFVLSADAYKIKYDELDKKISALTDTCKENENALQNMQVFCTRMRETQTEMQDKISNKRPVVKFTQPMQVEIVEKKGKGVKALIRK